MDIGLVAVRFALRRALWQDRDATVRAAAALQLGRTKAQSDVPTTAEVAGWLADACGDEAPLVREAALRALARMASRLPVLSRAERATLAAAVSASDPVWWVRRAALLAHGALLSLQPDRAVPLLRQRLGDPFWRVRHAAAQALYAVGLRVPSLRETILAPDPELSGPAQAGLWYLRTRFQPSIDVHSFSSSQPDEPLLNADPAVTTARLRAQALGSSAIDPHALVRFFADPHEPLRRLAFEHLRVQVHMRTQQQGSASEHVQSLLHALLPWLETPTQPHAAETTAAFLDGLGEPALALCREILRRDSSSPGALRWAAGYVAQLEREDLRPLLLRHGQHPRAAVRAAVMAALVSWRPRIETDGIDSNEAPRVVREPEQFQQALARGLADESVDVRSLAMIGIVQSRDESLRAVALRQSLSSLRPGARIDLVDLAARQKNTSVVSRALSDRHPLVRARALRALHRGDGAQASALQAALTDRDPELRLAALPTSPESWISLLCEDPDPSVRRAALRLLASQRAADVLGKDAQQQAGLLAYASEDVWLRTHAAGLLRADQDEGLRVLLALSRDPEESVRAAAADGLQDPGIAPRLRALLQPPHGMVSTLSAEQRAAAYAWIALHEGPAAIDLLDRAARSDSEPAQVRTVLPSLRFLAGGDASALSEAAVPDSDTAARGAEPQPAAAAPRRTLGRTGIRVSPLGISGAYDPPLSALHRAHQAGVNLFFWEPGYLKLTRFLRRQCRLGAKSRSELVIVAGSFEGDRIGIERDVARALRRLRTGYLDVLLLLWVRSPERLSAEALDCLRDLKRRGVIRSFGFSTHQRDLAETAAQSGDWDVLMLRHSAAHPGAEDRLLPLCAEKKIGVITFSALSYGRLLRPQPTVSEVRVSEFGLGSALPEGTEAAPDSGWMSGEQIGPLPTAVDCYRYSLSQTGVTACWSAPRSHSELAENLAVLSADPLPAADRERLRRQGQLVHAEDRRFRAFLRKGHDGAPEVLAHVQAPAPDVDAGTGEASGWMDAESAGIAIGDSLSDLLEASAPLEDPALPAHEVLADPPDYDADGRYRATQGETGEGASPSDSHTDQDVARPQSAWRIAGSTWTTSVARPKGARRDSEKDPLRSLLSRRRKPEKM